jgi:hypothetical protein
MSRQIILKSSKEEFLEKLSAQTILYHRQSFFALPDDKLVLKIRSNSFKLWPRANNALLPIMVGTFEWVDDQLVLWWYFRPPIIPALFYVAWIGFFVVLLFTGLIPSIGMIVIGSLLVAFMRHAGKPFKAQMERLVVECAK